MMSNLLNFSPPLFSGKTSFNIGSTINLSTVSLNRFNIGNYSAENQKITLVINNG